MRRVFSAFLCVIFLASCFFFVAFPSAAQAPFSTVQSDPAADVPLEEDTSALDAYGFVVTFSQAGGFFHAAVALDLAAAYSDAFLAENGYSAEDAASETSIYYTLDGSEPTPAGGQLFTGVFSVSPPGAEVSGVCVRAKAYLGALESPVFTNTYFVSDAIDERFDVLVCSITAAPDDLYGYENGILVTGRLFDEHEPDTTLEKSLPEAQWPAGYNQRGQESERAAHVQIFDETGAELISQQAGIRVHGGWTRYFSQKSLRLIARKEYDPANGKFKYPFFADNRSHTDEQFLVEEYDQMLLRSGGQDFGNGYIRDVLTAGLARASGFQDTQFYRPAAVFLNGEYYGFAWMQSVYSEKDLQTRYDTPSDAFEIAEVEIAGRGKALSGSEEAQRAWNEVCAFSTQDLQDDAVFQQLTTLVDVESFLRILAINTYCGNHDYFENNMKVYRYTGPPGGSEEIADGRWRFLAYDFDYTFAADEETAYDMPSLTWLMGSLDEEWAGNVECGLLIALMQRQDMRDFFIGCLRDYASNAFSAAAVDTALQEYAPLLENELSQALALRFPEKALSDVWAQHSDIRNFAARRAAFIEREIKENFGASGKTFRIQLTGSEGADVTLSSLSLSGPGVLAGKYGIESAVTLRATARYGYTFDHWLVNGQKVYEPTLSLSYAGESLYEASPVLCAATFGDVIISEVYYSGDSDWIELYNPTDHTISLNGYTLSDDEEEPDKFFFSGVSIRAGEYLLIACKNNKSLSLWGKPSVNFSLKRGETLTCRAPDGTVVDTVTLKKALPGQSFSFDPLRGAFCLSALPTPGEANAFPLP